MDEVKEIETLHEVPCREVDIGEFRVTASLVCHPGPTVGYRVTTSDSVLAYLPDHEPALGARTFPAARDWTSGYALAEGADLLIHDAQYSREEYAAHQGWGIVPGRRRWLSPPRRASNIW